MARSRNYKAEYQARIRREQERARAQGREFSRHKARGHTSRAHERAERVIRRERKLAFDLNALIEATRWHAPHWDLIVQQAIEDEGLEWTVNRLRSKLAAGEANRHGDKSLGDMAWAEYTTRKSYLPVELYWYHAND